MKVKCDFCGTEYNLERAPSCPIKCAVCGNTWTVRVGARRNTFFTFLAALCALLSAIVFVIVLMMNDSAHTHQDTRPLVVTEFGTHTETDESGVAHIVVTGNVKNQSTEIYGVPDLIIVYHDENGRVLGQQRFMPTVTLLDAGASAPFTHTLGQVPSGTKSISPELPITGGIK